MICIVDEAQVYEFSDDDERKTEEQFTDDYIAHIDESCAPTYDAIWAAISESSMSVETTDVYRDTLEQMHEVVIHANAARYWDYFHDFQERKLIICLSANQQSMRTKHSACNRRKAYAQQHPMHYL